MKTILKNKRAINLMLLLSLLVVIIACKKENPDFNYDYRRDLSNMNKSMVRLINLSKNHQLIADGDSLTNFFVAPRRSGHIPPSETTPPGTKYFPKDGRLGLIWDIPQELFKNSNGINFKVSHVKHITEAVFAEPFDFTATDGKNQAKDYYFLRNTTSEMQNPTNYVEIPRSITAPSKPDHFKIRIINLARKLSPRNPMEDLSGPVTLTFADGTTVSEKTSNIAMDSWSDYVDVPYGTYQFKVLSTDGRQLPGQGQTQYAKILPKTSEMEGVDKAQTGLVYGAIQTYQPGGVYSIVVHPDDFTWTSGRDEINNIQNCYRTIADISEPLNRTFTRLQLANALINQDLTLSINGKSSASTTATQSSEYIHLVAGKHLLEVKNKASEVVYSEEQELLAGQNYSLWLHLDEGNKVHGSLAANNLSGSTYIGQNKNGNNAIYDRMKLSYFIHVRYFNFCKQLPLLTVASSDGQNFLTDRYAVTGANIPLNQMNYTDNYATIIYNKADVKGSPYHFTAFRSEIGRVPGDWLRNISPLSSESLIRNKALYTKVNRKVPVHEPGVYSIALIGDLSKTNEQEKPKFMIVKHTK